MRKIAIGLLALLGAWPSFSSAADLPKAAVLKAPAAVVAPSGLYLGIGATAGNLNQQFDFLTVPGFGTGNINPTGWGVVGTFGYRAWTASGGYIGVNSDVGYLFTKGGTQCVIADQCTTKNDWRLEQTLEIGAPLAVMTGQVAALGSRVAASVPASSQFPLPTSLPLSAWAGQLIPFIALGVAERDVSACITGSVINQGCTTTWLVGFTAGGGFYIPIAASVDVKTKVMWTDWNKTFTPGNVAPIPPLLAGTFKSVQEVGITESLVFHF